MKLVYMKRTLSLIETKSGGIEALALISSGEVIERPEGEDNYLLIKDIENESSTLQERHEGED